MQVARHEQKGLEAYLGTKAYHGLCIPLMCLIDYRGWRLSACCQLPIGKNTLVYGSDDGGRTVHRDVLQVNDWMESASQVLNIKGHFVAGQLLHAPVDIVKTKISFDVSSLTWYS